MFMARTMPALAATLIAGATFATMAEAQTMLAYGEPAPNRGPRAEAVKLFADEVDRLTGGSVKVHVDWGGAIYSATAAVQSIRDGVADAGTIIAAYAPKEMISYAIADLPLGNADLWVGVRATDELMRTNEAIKRDLADRNLVYIGTYTTGAVEIGCKGDPIRSVEDLKGRKVRGASNYGDVFRDVGATLVNMSIYDAYQGLETGLIDCVQTYTYTIQALKFGEVIDNFTLLGWGQIGGIGIFMNKDSHDRLSPEQQEALGLAGVAAADKAAEAVTAGGEVSLKIMSDMNKEVVTLSDEERVKLIAASEPYVARWVEQADAVGLPGQALLDEYKGLIAKYTAEVAEKGYPWTR